MIRRNITQNLLDALSDTRVVLLHGARQSGKTTLVRAITEGPHPARYLTLDDAGSLAAANADPSGFISGLSLPVAIDEVQRAPELFSAIKIRVDSHPRAGSFLLTGSANLMTLPRLSEFLAGRMEVLTLWPLSQGEIDGRLENFVDAAMDGKLPDRRRPPEDRIEVTQRILRGGYPEVLLRQAEERREAWYASYLTTILQRDVRDLSQIEGLSAMPRLLALLASRSATLANLAELSRGAGIPLSTLRRYVALLESTFLIHLLPAWSVNLGKRVVKAPKVMICDTGLMAHSLGMNAERLLRDQDHLGRFLENFVVMELRKQTTWSRSQVRMFHYRTHSGEEVDVILESSAGHIVGIEVKAASTVGNSDFKGLRKLADATGKRFRLGVLMYLGASEIPFGPRLYALPVSSLWQ